MSTKSTIFLDSCCHIYKDVIYHKGVEKQTLCIDVSYSSIDDQDQIEVEWDSDFAKLVRKLLEQQGNKPC